jgi:hypothetical protein
MTPPAILPSVHMMLRGSIRFSEVLFAINWTSICQDVEVTWLGLIVPF